MRWATPAWLLLLAGCHENMVQQPKYDAYEDSPLFADGKIMQPSPAGTVPRDARRQMAGEQRPPMSLALLNRGRERFGIYCSMCHGYDGQGDGIVPSRGFPRPPSFYSARLRAMADSHFYDVASHGYGVMYGYSDRVSARDRWAIAAYIRALQMSRRAEARP